MKFKFTTYAASIVAIAASSHLMIAQDADIAAEKQQEVKTKRIAVFGDDFKEIRKRVAEKLENANVSAEVRERVLKELDSVQVEASKVREKVADASKDAKLRLEQKFRIKDGDGLVELLIDGSDGEDRVGDTIENIVRAHVLRDLDQKYRIGVACSATPDENNNSAAVGLTIKSVFPDSPASKVGIHEMDVLVAIDGVEVKKVEELSKAVQAAGKDGKELELKLLRDSKEVLLKIKPAEIKDTDKLVESLQLNKQPSGFVFSDKGMLGQFKVAGNRAGSNVIALSGHDDLKKEIEMLRKEIQELKELIKDLKSK